MARFLLVFLLTLDSLYALPRFAVRSNAKCQSCHVNQTGAGMRNFYGSTTYGRETLPIPTWQQEFALDEFSTQITDFLSYGLDFRFLYFYQTRKINDRDSTRSSFFPMQMDVYFNLRVSKKINVYVNPAFGSGVTSSRWEMFGVAQVLPLDGYLKAGRFTPSYGLRIDDHNLYVREKTPFRNNQGQAAGIEVGISPGPLLLMASATNVAGDRDAAIPKAIIAKAEVRFSLEKANVLLGGSSFNRVTSSEKINLLGGYGLLSWDSNATLMGAMEYIRGNSSDMSVNGERLGSNTAGNYLKQYAVTAEADYIVTQGVDLKLIYDFFDPDVDQKTGTATRYSAGVEFFPVSGVEIRPLYRYTNDTVLGRKTSDVQVLLHFYL
jgi:opacity protein-like surface antigen